MRLIPVRVSGVGRTWSDRGVMTDPLREDRFQQKEAWQDTYGHVHKLVEMARPYREAVLAMLRRGAAVWHAEEIAELDGLVYDERKLGDPPSGAVELLAAAWVLTSSEWLEGTPLVRELVRSVAEERAADPAGRHTCLRCAVEMTVVEVHETEAPHVVWTCPECGVRVRHDRPREAVDVEDFTAEGHPGGRPD